MKSFILALAFTIGVAAQAGTDTITFSGTGVINVQPDQAEISLAINTLAKTQKLAVELNAEAKADLERVIANDLKLDPKSLTTSHYSMGPQSEWVDGKSVPKGFGAQHSLSLKISKLEDVARVIDVLGTVRGTSMGGISYSNSNHKELTLKAYKLAVEDARAKANAVAEAAGLSVVKVSDISEPSYNGGAVRFESAAMARSAAADTSINTSDLAISATVVVVFKTN